MILKLLYLALAGALGTLARYGVSEVAVKVAPGYPWGTLAVNLIGCFLFGLVWSLAEYGGRLSPDARTLVLVGFMGAFTTFSSFSNDVVQMLRGERYGPAAATFLAHNALGIGLFFAGLALGKR